MNDFGGDESFQAINCTGTDNQKQGNKTLHTPQTQKRNRKKTMTAHKTNNNPDWYNFYDLRPKNKAASILTPRSPHRAHVCV